MINIPLNTISTPLGQHQQLGEILTKENNGFVLKNISSFELDENDYS